MGEAKRGRPRQYVREKALDEAVAVFGSRGYAAATLDELGTAMGMNRPSIYAAFGDKEAVYRHALEHFVAQMRRTVSEALADEPNLERALVKFYTNALDVYFGNAPALGCLVFCTAPAEAIQSPGVRGIVRRLIAELDDLLERKFADAQRAGRWPRHLDPGAAAKLAQATLHSIALRARAGESRRSLARFVRDAVPLLAPGRP